MASSLLVFAALMVLLGLTVGISYLDLGAIGLAIALVIAGVKAALIILYFMHVRHGSRLQALFAFSAFLWLALLIVITLSDYFTRIPGTPIAG